MILFERIKSVISLMARGPQREQQEGGLESADEDGVSGASIKENKIVMTELMGKLLK